MLYNNTPLTHCENDSQTGWERKPNDAANTIKFMHSQLLVTRLSMLRNIAADLMIRRKKTVDRRCTRLVIFSNYIHFFLSISQKNTQIMRFQFRFHFSIIILASETVRTSIRPSYAVQSPDNISIAAFARQTAPLPRRCDRTALQNKRKQKPVLLNFHPYGHKTI